MNSVEQAMAELGAAPNVPLARHTFVQVGGPADWFLTVRNRCELTSALAVARECELPLHVLGAGSNVLIRDGGLRGLVIKNESRACRLVSDADNDPSVQVIEIDSGARFATLARATARAGLIGLEWAAGIPGAVGGGLPTNAGAYGGELADIFVSAETVAPDGTEITLWPGDIDLRYRDSALRSGPHAELIVTSVRLRLRKGDPQAAFAEIERVERLRKTNAPTGPSLGSTFRNPPGDHRSAGVLIDQAGLRGHRFGAAQVSTLHANYILNRDVANATAADFIALIEHIQQQVRDQFGISLEPEIALLGEEAP